MKKCGLGYFYKKKGWKYFLKISSLLLTIILVNQFLIPSQAFAKNKFGKSIPLSININMSANYESGCRKVVSNFKANIRGTADLIEEKGESLRYASKNLTVFYDFKEDHIEMCDRKCLGKTVEQRSGSGNAKLENFLLDIFLGQTGKFAWIASQGRAPTPEELKMPKDVYQVGMVAQGNLTLKTKPPGGCEPVYNGTTAFPIGFFVGRAEIKPWGATGSYRWHGNYGVYEDKSVLISRVTDPVNVSVHEPKKFYQVSWTFGEVKPVVRIYREREDITDKKFEEVIVGKKVKLKAKVFPEGSGAPQGKWEIGGEIVSGWDADENHATLRPFTDYDKNEIEFFWVDGEFTGKQQVVKYSGQVNGKDVKAKTTFNVFKPKIKSGKAETAKMITIGIISEDNKSECQIYPGYVEPPVAMPPGIIISHEIEMPSTDEQIQHLLQYVQLVRGDALAHHNVIYQRKSNDQSCLDTDYPYPSKPESRVSFRIKMDDTPQGVLGKLTWEYHIQDEFQTYLMFIPSSDPADKNALWVPLLLTEWEWAAGVKKGEDLPLDAPCDKKTYKPIYEVPPRVKGVMNTFVHPEWSCNIKDTKTEKIGSQEYQDENWKRLTTERERRWRGK